MNDHHIIWIENQLEYCGAHLKVLRRAGYIVDEAPSPEIGLEKLRNGPISYSLIILDILMGEGAVEGRAVEKGRTGLPLYDIIRDELGLRMPIIWHTVIVDPQLISDIRAKEEERDLGFHLLHKPSRPSELLDEVRASI